MESLLREGVKLKSDGVGGSRWVGLRYLHWTVCVNTVPALFLLLQWVSESDRIQLHYRYLFALHYSWGSAALNMGVLITAGLLLLLGTSSVFLVFHNGLQDLLWPKHVTIPSMLDHRKLKEGSSDLSSSFDYQKDLSELNLKDYRIADPVPSTPTAVRSGPIEHGAPFGPWRRIKGPQPPPSHFGIIHAP